MLQCGLGELKGSRGVLVVFRVVRVSTAEHNSQLQALGRGLGGWVEADTHLNTEKLCHLQGVEWICEPLLSLRGVSMALFSEESTDFQLFTKNIPLSDLEGKEVMF